MQATAPNALVSVITKAEVEEQTGLTLKEKFLPFFDQANEWKRIAEKIVVTDVSQKEEMQAARKTRLALKEIRVNADKTRKQLKEDSLRYGRAVQGVYNVIEYLIVPIEEYLEKQEKFAEIQEAERREKLRAERKILLSPYQEFVAYNLDLAGMTEDDFQKIINGAKLQLQAKHEAIKKAEEERIARERAESEERERIRLENERLKAEAEVREREMREEREKAEAERQAAEKQRQEIEAKAEAERLERMRLEKEIEARTNAEREAKAMAKAKQEAEDVAKNAAPDAEKLAALAIQIEGLQMPELSTDKAKNALRLAEEFLKKAISALKENH